MIGDKCSYSGCKCTAIGYEHVHNGALNVCYHHASYEMREMLPGETRGEAGWNPRKNVQPYRVRYKESAEIAEQQKNGEVV